MNAASAERAVTARDCAMLIALPLERAAFLERFEMQVGYVVELARAAGWNRRLAGAAWEIYRSMVVTPMLRAASKVSAHGAEVTVEAHPRHFAASVARYSVVTVFAHCDTTARPETVEFFSGPRSVEQVAELVLPAFAGVLDLALCRSSRIGNAIKRVRPGCLFVSHTARVVPAFRAAFYASTIDLIARFPQRFTEATANLAKTLSDDYLRTSKV